MGKPSRNAVPALLAAALAGAAEAPWRSYEVYQPTIERTVVCDAASQRLKYNHDSTIAWFRDRWYCLWNANEPPIEGKPGQLNYQSTSPDGKTWSAPVACFADPARSTNPIPCPKGTQWQPNLIVVEGELWAVWSQNSRDEHNGTYLSRLAAPDGLWTHQRLLFADRPDVVLDGRTFRVFPTQDPIRLRSGRVLAPVTLMGPTAADVAPGVERWWDLEKRDSVLYSDDRGQTWACSPGAIQPNRSWAQWEPTVWEKPDGTVMMFARNNDMRQASQGGPRTTEMLLWSESRDQGATWTPHQPVPLETVCSRMHVLPAGGDRFVMVHNDWPAGRFVDDRRNLALFFNHGGGIDFVPGPGISGDEPAVMYPMAWAHNGAAMVSYSQGLHERSIVVARIAPLPDPQRHYLFPRSNIDASQQPVIQDHALRFSGGQHLATREVLDPGRERSSLGAWVRKCQDGALLDSRCDTAPGGILVGLTGGRPFVFLGTKDHNLISELPLDRGAWNYVGVSVDTPAATVLFVVNDRVEVRPFTGPLPKPLKAGPGMIGRPGPTASLVACLRGELRELAVYREQSLTQDQHRLQAQRLAAALGRTVAPPAVGTQPVAPSVLLDPASPDALQADFRLPDDRRPAAITAVTEDGRSLLRISGEASAGVDLDANRRASGDTVELQLRFRLEQGDHQVLLTLGDANQPARLVQRQGRLALTAGSTAQDLGPVASGTWFDVTVSSSGEQTAAQCGDGPRAVVAHRPLATWAYLGQAFRNGSISADCVFALDVGACRSRVVRP